MAKYLVKNGSGERWFDSREEAETAVEEDVLMQRIKHIKNSNGPMKAHCKYLREQLDPLMIELAEAGSKVKEYKEV